MIEQKNGLWVYTNDIGVTYEFRTEQQAKSFKLETEEGWY